MTKKHRLTKVWQRNWEFYIYKGIYFLGGPVKYWVTPRQLNRYLRKEDIKEENLKRNNYERKYKPM